MLDVLVIAPHPDDAELGMAGTILKMRQDGWQVGVLDLTDGEPTPHGTREIRQRETDAATQVLGISWRENLGLENRQLVADLKARHRLACVIRRTQPRWLFAPYWVDAHPDHLAATQLIEAARFWAKLTKSDLEGEPHHPEKVFHYYCVHLRLALQPDFILDISPFWETKQRALECYHSQLVQGREQVVPGFIERLREQAAHWGSLIGRRYGEPFACREPIGMTSLRDLI